MKLKKMLAAMLTMAMVATALPVTAMAATTANKLPDPVDGVITLTDDYVLTEGHEITGTVKLDLNGHSITPDASFTKGTDGKEDYLLAVKRGGTLTIVDNAGGGIIDGSSNNKIVCAVKMTIFGEEPTGDAATLIVDGAAIKGAPYGISGNGNRHDTSVTIIDGNISGTTLGIFQPQDGELVIKGGTITGATGVEVRNGEVKVTGGTITGTGSEYSLAGSGNGNTTSGAGLAVVPHDGETVTAEVTDGTIKGVVGVVATASDSRVKDEPNQTKEGEATVTLSGGTIDADEYGVRVLDGSKVTLAGADVKSDLWGVYVRGLSNNAQATTFNVTGGSITAVGAPAISGSGNENAYDNTVINISGDAEITSTNDVAIYQPQNGVLNISGEAEITGTSGVHAKDGTVNVSGDAVITGTAMGETYNPDAVADGAQGTGAAILLESNTASYGTPVANISGGTMNSSSSAVDAVEAQKAAGETNAVAAAVSGGTFSTPVAPEMLTTGAAVIENGGEYSYYPNVNAAKDAAQEIADETGTNVSVYEAEDLNADGTVKEDAQGETVQPTPAPTPSTPKKSTKKYSVSVDTDEIENGSIKLSSSKVKKGATVTLTVTPDAGYELDKLVVLDKDGDVVELTDKGDGKFTFKMPRGGVEVDASFVEADAVVVKDTAKIVLTIDSIVALVNGEPVVNDVAPIIKGERTFLPIRLIAEELGATVTWNEAEQSVTIVKDDMGIVIYIGQAFALVNGEPVQLDAPAFIQNDRTYLPVRFISENLGAVVTWDDTAKTVTIVG